ncbi:MAG: cache domain-containing protein [Candidatus Eisenbacteria bacterium]|nr:cache domain-containing protein [Candidatus Eisenbacteria bacterium]
MREKLTISFVLVIIINGIVTSWVGVHLMGDEIIRRAQNNVRTDLNSAREVYRERLGEIRDVVRFTAVRSFLKDSLVGTNWELTKTELEAIRKNESLDVLTLADKDGVVLLRARHPDNLGDNQMHNPIVAAALSTRKVVASTEILSVRQLREEGDDLAKQARVRLVATPMTEPTQERVETSGMMLEAAAPIFDDAGALLGVLYAGKLLNKNYEIVDKVKDMVYKGEKYKGKDTGTATIFQGDLRISTNVRKTAGERAIGTRVSKEVYDEVIKKGVPWIGRAFVVNGWYITAYEPIRSLNGKIIGMLYVGMLEAPYIDLRRRLVFTFLGIALLTAFLLSLMVHFMTGKIIFPLKRLVVATEEVARGDLSHRVKINSQDELGQLAESFNAMTAELQRADDRYQALTKTLEDKVRDKTQELRDAQDQLLRSEKLSSLGKMAAGIAHEINNPLTSILINSHLIAEKLTGEEKQKFEDNLKLIIDETTRSSAIVSGLLEFSRQTPPEKKPADVNEVIEETLVLLRSQVLAHNVEIDKELGENLPKITIDENKIKQVFTNVILNGLDAMPDGGTLFIASRLSPEKQCVIIMFRDTGCGIPATDLGKIFDPFFSTKGTKGTGLGLSVSYGIIEQHSGRIDVQSEVGNGTTLSICLPMSESRKV